MVWAYSGWITERTTKAREENLRLHVKEVSDAISIKMQSDGTMVDPTIMQEYRTQLMADLDKIKGGGSKLTRGRIIKL